jgi:hypothetical protein
MVNDLHLSRLFSFTSLAVAWIFARMAKFTIYGISGFGYQWNSDPGFLERTRFLLGTVIGMSAVLVVLAMIVDAFLWPFLFRDAVNEIQAIDE